MCSFCPFKTHPMAILVNIDWRHITHSDSMFDFYLNTFTFPTTVNWCWLSIKSTVENQSHRSQSLYVCVQGLSGRTVGHLRKCNKNLVKILCRVKFLKYFELTPPTGALCNAGVCIFYVLQLQTIIGMKSYSFKSDRISEKSDVMKLLMYKARVNSKRSWNKESIF